MTESGSVKQKKVRTKKAAPAPEPAPEPTPEPVQETVPETVDAPVKKTRKPRKPKAETTEAPVETPKKSKKEKASEKTEEKAEEKEAKKVVKRVFTVLSVKETDGTESEFKGGKYFSKTPAGAARKSANQACKILYNDQDCVVEVLIKEITKNGSSKEYSYRAERKLAEKTVPFKGNSGKIEIPFKYSMVLKSLKTEKGKKVATTVPQSELDTVDESVA